MTDNEVRNFSDMLKVEGRSLLGHGFRSSTTDDLGRLVPAISVRDQTMKDFILIKGSHLRLIDFQ